MSRWLRFNLVGVMGAAVQAAVLHLLTANAGFDYLTATGIAVEAAILHNFVWHVHWTFSDRHSMAAAAGSFNVRTPIALTGKPLSRAFVRFQLQAGLISIPGNLVVMWLLVDQLRCPVAAANIFSIAACSAANFVLADRFSFKHDASRTT